jgi:hypothetical protein
MSEGEVLNSIVLRMKVRGLCCHGVKMTGSLGEKEVLESFNIRYAT